MGGQAAGQGASFFASMMPLFLIMLVFYFLVIRPQSKKQKEHQKMVDELKKGDKVIISGGIYGTIAEIMPGGFKVKVAENVNIQIVKSAVSVVVPAVESVNKELKEIVK